MTLPKSGINLIDSLLLGGSWTGGVGSGTTIDYTFTATSELEVNQQLEAAVAQVLRAYSDVAAIRFDRQIVSTLSNQIQQARFIDGEPNLAAVPFQFAIDPSLGAGILGLAEFPFIDAGTGFSNENTITAVDMRVSSDAALLQPGQVGYFTLLHEVGHGLGLAHPDTLTGAGGSQDGTVLPDSQITNDASVMMSLFPTFRAGDFTEFNSPQTPMIFDIAALQYIYGANTNTNRGDTVYEFDGTVEQSRTIWDAGGTDTISTMNATQAAVIDLREGFENVTQVGDANTAAGVNSFVWLAFGANIENAKGGLAGDTIFGNTLNNTINGRVGNDRVDGFEGNDTLRGGKGNDSIDGGSGNDLLKGDLNDDIISGSEGDDFVNGNQGSDLLVGGTGNDVLRGGQDNDEIFGLSGNDIIFGDRGNDALSGGSGADTFVFAAGFGQDVIDSFEAAGAGVIDILQISPLLASSAQQVLQQSVSTGTDLFIDFGGGNTITLLGVTGLGLDDIVIG